MHAAIRARKVVLDASPANVYSPEFKSVVSVICTHVVKADVAFEYCSRMLVMGRPLPSGSAKRHTTVVRVVSKPRGGSGTFGPATHTEVSKTPADALLRFVSFVLLLLPARAPGLPLTSRACAVHDHPTLTTLQLSSQPPCAPASSHTSPGSMNPLPHSLHTLLREAASSTHTAPACIVQLLAHPCPWPLTSPLSHCSAPALMPSPHVAQQTDGLG